ncbi:MAG: hypothetical protein M1457_08630, partial [bacterium]|nr:hypothetical protein [bacterium]
VATAICPHTLGARPVILPPRPPLTLEFQARHGSDHATLWIDGQEKWPVDEGDRVTLVADERPLRLICWPGCQYFSLLRRKLHWSGQMPPTLQNDRHEGYD